MKVLKNPPEEWPMMAKSIYNMARIYRVRAKGWRENMRNPLLTSDDWKLQNRIHIRRDREEVALMMQWVRQALGAKPKLRRIKS